MYVSTILPCNKTRMQMEKIGQPSVFDDKAPPPSLSDPYLSNAHTVNAISMFPCLSKRCYSKPNCRHMITTTTTKSSASSRTSQHSAQKYTFNVAFMSLNKSTPTRRRLIRSNEAYVVEGNLVPSSQTLKKKHQRQIYRRKEVCAKSAIVLSVATRSD